MKMEDNVKYVSSIHTYIYIHTFLSLPLDPLSYPNILAFLVPIFFPLPIAVSLANLATWKIFLRLWYF